MMTSKKAPGFYAGMLACVLAIAAAVCYGVVFPGIEYKEQVFDIRICVILAAAGILAAVLLLAGERTAGFAPALLCLGSGVALMLLSTSPSGLFQIPFTASSPSPRSPSWWSAPR